MPIKKGGANEEEEFTKNLKEIKTSQNLNLDDYNKYLKGDYFKLKDFNEFIGIFLKKRLEELKENFDKEDIKLDKYKILLDKKFGLDKTEDYNELKNAILIIEERNRIKEAIKNKEYDANHMIETKKFNELKNVVNKNQFLKDKYDKIKEKLDNIKIGDKSITDRINYVATTGKIEDDIIKEKAVLNFVEIALIFKSALKFFTFAGVFFAFIVLFISFLGIVILIYDMIYNTIKLFVNSPNSTNNLSLDYINKSIIKCNKTNYKNDRYYILTEQKQNLTIFNLGAYTLYLLIIYLIAYYACVFISQQLSYEFIGKINDIDSNNTYLFMIALLLVYSFIHLLLFKFFFKPYVYIPYKSIDDEEKNIDRMISEKILVKTQDNKNITFSDFFDLLYDASKIDQLNSYFLQQIKNKDNENCLKQKLIIYNLYEYLRQYVYFDEDFQANFVKYCSNDENNKPEYDSGNTITFISMLKNDEVKIISNSHENLDFINNLEDDSIEFYNQINTEVSNIIKDINKKIITHNKTTLPFFITIIYIILIFLFNFAIVYWVVFMIRIAEEDAYHPHIRKATNYLNTYVYDKIIKLIYK